MIGEVSAGCGLSIHLVCVVFWVALSYTSPATNRLQMCIINSLCQWKLVRHALLRAASWLAALPGLSCPAWIVPALSHYAQKPKNLNAFQNYSWFVLLYHVVCITRAGSRKQTPSARISIDLNASHVFFCQNEEPTLHSNNK